MAYETLMVYVGLGRPNDELLQVAGDLAVQFRASVIGVAARQPARVSAGEGFVFWDSFDIDPEAVCGEIDNTEAEFRRALQCRVADLQWRSAAVCASIADYLAHEVRSADVLIIGIAADVFNSRRRVNACDLAALLGRPVIIVPTSADRTDVGREESSVRCTALDSQTVNEALGTFGRAPRMSIDQMLAWIG